MTELFGFDVQVVTLTKDSKNKSLTLESYLAINVYKLKSPVFS